jgi:hypothetical protein
MGTGDRLRHAPRVLAMLLLCAVAYQMIAVLWQRPVTLQWDFQSYYHASVAHQRDLSPYEARNLSLVSGKRWMPVYLYPPLTVHLFDPFRAMPYPVAVKVWLCLKLAMLGGVVVVWHRFFTRAAPPILFAAFLLLGFGSTVYWDLHAGNVSIMEQFLLWLAFLGLLKGRAWAFCALLVAASVFKLAFMLFLPLPLLLQGRRAWLPVATGGAVFVAYVLANRLLQPDLFAQYVTLAVSVKDLGSRFNLGSLALVKDVFAYFGAEDAGIAPLVVYGLVVVGVLAVTVRVAGPARALLVAEPRLAVFLASALYVMVMPRMKSYSFIILLPAAWHAVRRSARSEALPYLLVLLLLPVRAPFHETAFLQHLTYYWSLYLACLVWGLLLAEVRRGTAPGAPGHGG